MKLLWAATAGAIGCNLGSLVAYEMAAMADVRWSSVRTMDSDGRRELDWADRFFQRWGDMAVFIARCCQ